MSRLALPILTHGEFPSRHGLQRRAGTRTSTLPSRTSSLTLLYAVYGESRVWVTIDESRLTRFVLAGRAMPRCSRRHAPGCARTSLARHRTTTRPTSSWPPSGRTLAHRESPCADHPRLIPATEKHNSAELRRPSRTPRKLHPSPVLALVLGLQPEPAELEQLARAALFRDLWLLLRDLQLSA